MNKKLLQVIALLLVCCMATDQAGAIAGSIASPLATNTLLRCSRSTTRINQEALAAELFTAHRDLSSFLKPRHWVSIIAIGVVAHFSPQFHHSSPRLTASLGGFWGLSRFVSYVPLALTMLWKRAVWHLYLRPLILRSNTSDLHNHTSGSLGPKDLAEMFARNAAAVAAFKAIEGFAHIDPTDPDQLDTVLRWNEDHTEGLNGDFEKAFDIGKCILLNDPDFRFHREWYYRVTQNAARQGNHIVGIRSTFDQQKSSEDFDRAVQAAIEGIEQAEREVRFYNGIDCRGVIFLAIRKSTSPNEALRLVNHWLALRRRSPRLAARLVGVDSVSTELTTPINHHDAAFLQAKTEGIPRAFHIGEEWRPGELKNALDRIEYVIDTYSPQFLTNTLALFVDPDSLRGPLYDLQREAIRAQQNRLFAKIKEQDIVLEISPVSNKRITLKMRKLEHWTLRPLDPLLAAGIRIVCTADDGGIIQTSFLDELRRLYYGTTIYGPVSIRGILQLVRNSERVYHQFERATRQGRLAALSVAHFSGKRFPFTIEELDLEQGIFGPDKLMIQRLFDPGQPMTPKSQIDADLRIANWLAHKKVTRIWVSRDERGMICGYAWADLKVDESRAEIQGVGVDPAAQKNGIGTALFDVSVEAFSEMPEVQYIDTYDTSPYLDESDPEKGRTTGKIVTELVKPEHRFYSMDLDSWYRWEKPLAGQQTPSSKQAAPKRWIRAVLKAA